MAKMVITHDVVDVERWLKYKQERVDQLKPFAGSVTDNVAADGSKSIALVLDVKDLAAFQAAMAAPPPELAAAMERHGVIQPLKVYVEK